MKSTTTYVLYHRSARRKGRKDGRNWRWKLWPPRWPFRETKEAFPLMQETEPAAFEKHVGAVAESEMQTLAQEWVKEDKVLKPEFFLASADAERAKKAHTEEVELLAVRKLAFENANKELFGLRPPALRPIWMRVWLGAIGISEFFFNAIVFEIFGQGKLETYITAASMGIMFPLLAHYFGKSMRQEEKSDTDHKFIIVTPAVILGVLTALAIIRGKFLEAQDLHAVMGLNLSTTEATMLFVILNIGLCFAAAIASYEGSYPQNEHYRAIRKRVTQALRDLMTTTERAKKLSAWLHRAEDRLNESIVGREQVFKEFGEDARHVQKKFGGVVSEYRCANLESRGNGNIPESFRQPPAVPKIPAALCSLSWKVEDFEPMALLTSTEVVNSDNHK